MSTKNIRMRIEINGKMSQERMKDLRAMIDDAMGAVLDEFQEDANEDEDDTEINYFVKVGDGKEAL